MIFKSVQPFSNREYSEILITWILAIETKHMHTCCVISLPMSIQIKCNSLTHAIITYTLCACTLWTLRKYGTAVARYNALSPVLNSKPLPQVTKNVFHWAFISPLSVEERYKRKIMLKCSQHLVISEKIHKVQSNLYIKSTLRTRQKRPFKTHDLWI